MHKIFVKIKNIDKPTTNKSKNFLKNYKKLNRAEK